MPKILVVDDEFNIVELIKYNLEREGFNVLTAGDGEVAIKLAQKEKPDLIVLDVMMPVLDGLTTCRMLQQDSLTRHIPVIMLSARGEELDKVVGLEIGADDYITKPFSPRELIARIRARLRRGSLDNEGPDQKDDTGILVCGPLEIDQEKFTAVLNGKKLEFTTKEFELLFILASKPGKVFTREYLLDQLWGYTYTGDSRMVDVYIRHIRQKLEQNVPDQQFIETVRGVGYRFSEQYNAKNHKL